jgi:agmatine deiminase
MTLHTPKNSGFSMPAEWEDHSAVWLAWPYDDTTFPGRVPIAENFFVEMIFNLHTSEQVNLIVLNEKMEEAVKEKLLAKQVDLSKVTFYKVDFADVWIRDYGPTFITNKQSHEQAWIKWNYNGYGKAEDPYFGLVVKDGDVFFKLRGKIDKRMFEPGVAMEGGAIDVNGKGVLLTTEQCLLNPNRNPHLNKQQTEKYLIDNLGVSKIIWLKEGLVNDHTDGHIDEIARFISPDTIVCAYEENPEDENFKILDDNYKTLKKATDQDGNPFKLIKLQVPHMTYEASHSLHSLGAEKETQEAEKAAVSYCNFYIGNTVVLAASFNDPNDEAALKIIQSCFPDKKVVGLDCSDIIYGGGAIHCMTQQQPAID